MLSLLKNSDTLIIVLHEIYGINQHMKLVCEYYYKAGFDVLCPDLASDRRTFSYEEEVLAYSRFMENVGFEKAADQVNRLTADERKRYKYVLLLGFSAGATAAWLCSGLCGMYDGVIGYYGSRIRDYQSIMPKCPVILIYPEEEKSFNVQELSDKLNSYDMVNTHVFKGKHGFSDSFSVNYNKESHEESVRLVQAFIEKIRQ